MWWPLPTWKRKKWKRVLVAQSCQTLCGPMDCSPPGSSVHEIFPGKNTGVVCHFLLQEIFLTQGSNLCLLHCRQIVYFLSQHGRPFAGIVSPRWSSVRLIGGSVTLLHLPCHGPACWAREPHQQALGASDLMSCSLSDPSLLVLLSLTSLWFLKTH